MLAGIIILTLILIAVLTLGGMAFIMTMEAFGIVGAAVSTVALALLGVVVAMHDNAVRNAAGQLQEGTSADYIPVPFIVIGFLVLLVLGAIMMIGAIIGKRGSVTSWSNQEEQAFSSFDRRASSSQSTAWTFSLISGAVVFLFMAGIYFGVEPEHKDIGKTMNMSNLTKKQKVEDTEAPKTEAPKTEAPKTEAPKTEAPAPETK
ncbi:MAG: hypothetical protein H6Q90_4704 [Deltaproteobacteria bacterium]|nr:hypothetical protein [Deltaproteobacteria bacterium]